MRCGKPFLLTKYSGYTERFPGCGVIVDPLDETDMERGIEKLADDVSYAKMKERIASWDESHTYDDIAKEYIALINSYAGTSNRGR